MRPPLGWILTAVALTWTGIGCEAEHQGNPTTKPVSERMARARSKGPLGRSGKEPSIGPIYSIRDPRLASLLEAAERWGRARGPRRQVVDRVCLVPDLPSFFEAIAAWDEHSFFPILIDDPAWSLPFLRAFRPAQVARSRAAVSPGSSGPDENGSRSRWSQASHAVASAWSSEETTDENLPAADRVPRQLGPTPPGLVLSHAQSPMLAAAVALAAGRFQPLIDLDPALREHTSIEPDSPRFLKNFADVLSLEEARDFARRIEARAEMAATPSHQLGDACDFLTLAGDWPYRYRDDTGHGVAKGDHALDDLIGRSLEINADGLAEARGRWAFTGRIVGGPAASLYRAMCALFLQPESSLLWDTYGADRSFGVYRMEGAARLFQRVDAASPVVARAGAAASLAAWQRTLDPVSRFGVFMINSSGFPRDFAIGGGPGRPADLPRGAPAVVSFIHSFSAADPRDASTLAGRWLENGAFVYYGSMNEPFLQAFRTPGLVSELAAAGLPFSAAVREGESEPFGRPWRLVYLGDPLYSLVPTRSREPRLPPGPWPPAVESGSQPAWTLISASTAAPAPGRDAPERLEACLTAAIRSLCQGGSALPDRPAWLASLLAIDRHQLSPPSRGVLDELLIDSLLHAGESDRLLEILLGIALDEVSPRVEIALESLVMGRLMSLAAAGSLTAALELWDVVIRRPWLSGNPFAEQFTERLTGLLQAGPPREQGLYIEHLKTALPSLANRPELADQKALVARELTRLRQPIPSAR